MTPWPYPLWIAHRGAGKLAPENTLAAFRLGASYGYRAYECDVKLSADGVPFLMHDTTLERTTPERGVAGERSWSELSRLDAGGWHSRSYAGEPPASLDALASYLLRNGFLLDLEIKPTPGDERRTGEVVAAACRRLWAGQAVPPLLSSFQPEALAGAREAAPELPRALLVDAFWDGWYDAAQELGCVAIIPNYTTVDAGLVERARADGLRVLCYTVNDPSEARRLLAAGVAGLITDAVDRFSPDTTRVVD
ncbi:glycerophosphodiester phosphodiesterase [Rubrivivax gelatinosus]|uniref:glycerophosphodiester phosphodiesterase n=1 Tax=Rubrivivax gelatinosus TaxID=28068 RepID=UPI001906B289|nr:glycerophosphodiester phosphodiesterase [Rubrivivax gelatinosus]MBK1615199.1 glycerophosphodiester phosphodiesterase [Rubrivivax gelatinosus]